MAPPVAQHLRSISGVHRAAVGSTSLVSPRVTWLGLGLGLGLVEGWGRG